MQTRTEQPTNPLARIDGNTQLMIATGIFIPLLVLLFIADKIGWIGSKKNKLGDARFATDKEILKAKKYGFDLIEKRSRNKVALWVGEPEGIQVDREARTIDIPRDYRSFVLSHLEEHLFVLGSAGSGKSYSLMSPLQRAMIILGYPLIVFDAKGYEESEDSACPSSEIAGFARLHGYKVKIIAPDYDDSDIFNIFDMMKAKDGLEAFEDKDGAYTVSDVLNENMAMSAKESGDEFFPLASKQLMQAVFMWAKMLDENADFTLAYYLLKRIAKAGAKGIDKLKFPPYVQIAFDQFLVSAESPETAASIAGTALILFGRMVTPANTSTFCGKSTVDMHVKGKTLVIFRLNPDIKASVGPMLATALQCFLKVNCYTKRTQPLGVWLDEIQMIKIAEVQLLQTISRSNGVFFCFATQGFSFLEMTYGEKLTKGMVDGCKTQIIGQLNANESAKYYSEQLGEEEVQTRSKGRSSGKGASRSINDQPHLRHLVPLEKLMQLPQGHFYYLNRAFRNRKLARLPVRHETIIPQWEKDRIEAGIKEWFRYRKQARQISKAKRLSNAELEQRQAMAVDALPDDLINEAKGEAPTAGPDETQSVELTNQEYDQAIHAAINTL